MPNYTYNCKQCKKAFELFSYIKDFEEQPKCPTCGKKKTERLCAVDVLTQFSSVRKSNSELKTIGDLALRNTERMSEDEKIALYHKHNNYKDKDNDQDQKSLPKGMSRLKKPNKTSWPGQTGKQKRKIKK
jgi:putative FmdB family regulatory protein